MVLRYFLMVSGRVTRFHGTDAILRTTASPPAARRNGGRSAVEGARRGLDHTKVIEAAAELADTRGFQNVTLAMVASKLGVRSQSLYAHVDGLEGLRRGLARHGLNLFADAMRDSVMALTGAAALRALCRTSASFAAAHPGLYEANVRAPGDDPNIEAARARVAAPFYAVLSSFGVDGDESLHRHRVIWTSLYGFATARSAGLMSWPVDPDESFEYLLDTLVADLEARRARVRPEPRGRKGARRSGGA
jgi:AcrR family transcriptional regulator